MSKELQPDLTLAKKGDAMTHILYGECVYDRYDGGMHLIRTKNGLLCVFCNSNGFCGDDAIRPEVWFGVIPLNEWPTEKNCKPPVRLPGLSIDSPIWVEDGPCNKKIRHFAEWGEGGQAVVWSDGCTSLTTALTESHSKWWL